MTMIITHNGSTSWQLGTGSDKLMQGVGWGCGERLQPVLRDRKKVNRKVQKEPQEDVATNPRHQEEEKSDTYERSHS